MTRHKNIGFLLMMLVCLCFFSLPVMSGEHPWDADDDGNGDMSKDTTYTGDGNADVLRRVATDGSAETDMVTTASFVTRLTVEVSIWYYRFISDDLSMRSYEKIADRPSRIEKRTYSVKNY